MKYLSVLVLFLTVAFAACLDKPAAYAAKRELCLAQSDTCAAYVACVQASADPGDPPVGSCRDAGGE